MMYLLFCLTIVAIIKFICSFGCVFVVNLYALLIALFFIAHCLAVVSETNLRDGWIVPINGVVMVVDICLGASIFGAKSKGVSICYVNFQGDLYFVSTI